MTAEKKDAQPGEDKAPAKKAAPKKAAAKKAAPKKAAPKKETAKKAAPKKEAAKKAAPKKATAKKAAPKKAAPKKAEAKKEPAATTESTKDTAKKAAPKKEPAKKKSPKTGTSAAGKTADKTTGGHGMLRITQVKSQIGFAGKQKKVLVGLGLGRIGRTVTRKDDACIRGMVAKVTHLVSVEKVEG